CEDEVMASSGLLFPKHFFVKPIVPTDWTELAFIYEISGLILDNSDLLPKQAQEAAQKIYGLKNKIVGEIEDIIDEMRS
ncbi:MAG: hypothetical protein B0D91_11655, partial [Oceanospirillales bacterium LUC14_002_19_P2]